MVSSLLLLLQCAAAVYRATGSLFSSILRDPKIHDTFAAQSLVCRTNRGGVTPCFESRRNCWASPIRLSLARFCYVRRIMYEQVCALVCVCVCVAFRAQLNCANENIGSYDDGFGVRSQSTRYNRTKLLTFEQLSLASGILSRFNFCEVRRSSLQSVANFSICAR